MTTGMPTPTDLRDWARLAPAKPALRIGDDALDYGALEALANRWARAFRTLGLVRGDHVATMLPNCAASLAAVWGAYRAGLYLTPVSTTLTAGEAGYVADNSEARAVVVDVRHAPLVPAMRAAAPGCRHWLSHGGAIEGLRSIESALSKEAPEPIADESRGALMMYTSGTTGAPKGVWRALPDPATVGPPSFAADLLSIFGFDEHVRYLSTAPLYHAAPLRFALAVTAAGGFVRSLGRFDALAALQALSEDRITHSQWVPAMFQRLLALPDTDRRDFRAPAHRLAIHAAAPCPMPVKRAMIEWWGPILYEYYSGTEGVGLTGIDSHEWLAHPGSVGRTLKGVPHVVDDDDVELPPGSTGRIYFSGVPRFEYFNEPAKTAGRTLANGWQTLGDIGHVDADGYMYLTDRMDDMIISGGVNVYPQEIEEAVMELADVMDCGAVGVEDARFGERPVAFVVPRSATVRPGLEARVDAHCEARLGRIKRPERVIVVDELPRSATGKLLRRELRRLGGVGAAAG
jgi:acyl-CoA synthetase (AMP-forming)/AMP-acid ligase II